MEYPSYFDGRKYIINTHSLTANFNILRSRSRLLYDWKSVSQNVLVSSILVGLATRYYFLSECYCLKFAVFIYWAPSLTRGRVWNLQCNHSIVRVAQNPKPYFTVSSETPPTWGARFPYLYPPGPEWPTYTPKVEDNLRLTVSQSLYLGIEHPCGTCDQILLPVGMLLPEICGLVSVGPPLRREDGSAICSVITQWSESLRTPNHTLLSHLRLPQPGGPGSRIYIPQEQGGPVIPPGTGSFYRVPYPIKYIVVQQVDSNRNRKATRGNRKSTRWNRKYVLNSYYTNYILLTACLTYLLKISDKNVYIL
jgi:hypothetical protein